MLLVPDRCVGAPARPLWRRLVEFLCCAVTIPAIVLSSLLARLRLGEYFSELRHPTFAFVLLVLPFAYRAIEPCLSAIDIVTLSEAARSSDPGLACGC